MNGIDISHWQKGMKVENIQADFVIMKATEGNYYVDDALETFYAGAVKSNKLRGLYHFASGTNGAIAEAEYFVNHIKKYLGDCILCLDWEGDAVKKNPTYAKQFMDKVYELTGQRCFIYMSKSVCRSYNWASVASDYPLWVAQYPSYDPIYGYQNNPWTDKNGYGAWKSPAIFQYTSSGYLSGWKSRLDFNKCYITKEEWMAYQCKVSPQPQPTPVPEKKTVYELAKEVIAGKWGNGAERKCRLEEAGYNYDEIQKKVNEILSGKIDSSTNNNIPTNSNKPVEEEKPAVDLTTIAREVIQGKWGNGAVRKIKLQNAGYDYDEIQAIVNKLLK